MIVSGLEITQQDEMIKKVQTWNGTHKNQVSITTISRKSEVAASVFEGLQRSHGEERDIIISYSDIIWEEGLLSELISKKDGDIVIAVDNKWDDNYPKKRIWHDELYAELVFHKGGKIEKVGEPCHRYPDEEIPSFSDDPERWKNIFSKTLATEGTSISEIIGLFKFSHKAQMVFCREFLKLKRGDRRFKVKDWPKVQVSGKDVESVATIDIEEALLGSFLEYLNTNSKLNVRLLEVEGRWAEVDHVGDLSTAEERFKNWNKLS